MKFSRLCLKKYLECNVSSEKIAETLTQIGFPTEILTIKSKGLETLHIAHIIDKKAFVNDLNILTVEYIHEDSIRVIEVVCGDIAMNIDDYACMILIDEILPSTGKKLKSREIYGRVSPGMLCSAEELGISSNYDGVYKLQPCALSANIIDCIYPAGDIFDCEVTYNRGDLLSVIGIARELAAAGLGVLKNMPITQFENKPSTIMMNNADQYIRGAMLCKYTVGNLNQHDSIFLQQISQATGVFLVDIANDVVHEIGQPLHVYDADKISGQLRFEITQTEELFDGLNGQQYKIPAGILVARDDIGIISIVGMLGGARTACSYDTKNILLEAVNISAEYMSMCMNILKINTKSAQLFLHEIDTQALHQAVTCFNVKLNTTGEILYCKQYNPALNIISLDMTLAKKVCGELWNQELFEQRLYVLGFMLKNKTEKLQQYLIPSYRFDIDCPHVLIAEYLRMSDYNTIACASMIIDQKFTDVRHEMLKRIRAFLAIQLHEIITYKSVSEMDKNRCTALRMINPMSGVHYMRKNVLPSVLDCYIEQNNKGRICNGMFEISDGFEVNSHDGFAVNNNAMHANIDIIKLKHEDIYQTMYIAAIIQNSDKNFTLTSVQIYVQQLLVCIGIDISHLSYMTIADSEMIEIEHSKHQKQYVNKSDSLWLMQTDVCAYLYWKKIKIGTIGAIQDQNGVYGFEINLDTLLEKCHKTATATYMDYQYIYTKDFSIKLKATSKANELLKAAQKITFNDCKLVWNIFDVYPESRMIERNVGIRAQICSMHAISNDDMSKWYNDVLQALNTYAE